MGQKQIRRNLTKSDTFTGFSLWDRAELCTFYCIVEIKSDKTQQNPTLLAFFMGTFIIYGNSKTKN